MAESNPHGSEEELRNTLFALRGRVEDVLLFMGQDMAHHLAFRADKDLTKE